MTTPFNSWTGLTNLVGAGTIQMGAADAASPVAQTYQAQSVVTGTSNTAGALFTINLSRGTGSGTDGGLKIQGAPSGAGATTQNTFVNVLDYNVTNVNAWTFGKSINLPSSNFITTSNAFMNGSGGGDFTAHQTSQGFNIGSSGPNASDVFLTRAGTGAWRSGLADAASPVAQTLQVQSVVAGTNNTSGVNWTFNGSVSTGSGTSGDIIFQTGGTGAGATAQNSLIAALTIKGATQQVIMATNPRINVAPTAVTSGSSVVITSAADGATNIGHRISFNLNGTTYWIPCSSTAF